MKRDMMLDRVTLKQGKTHCEWGPIITDPIEHIVTDADADLENNQPFGEAAESIEMHVSDV